MMKRTVGVVVIVLALCGVSFAAQKGQDLYQQALVQERAVGSLEKAIELFQSAAKEAGGDRELAAKALIGAARCYEKLGQVKAAELYEEVARTYPDQQEQAAIARQRIASTTPPLPLGIDPQAAVTPGGALFNLPAGGLLFRRPNNQLIDQLAARIADLRIEEAGLAVSFPSEFPNRVRLRSQIAAAEQALRAEQAGTLQAFNELAARITELRKEESELAVTFSPEYPRRVRLRNQIAAAEEAFRSEQQRLIPGLSPATAAYDTSKPFWFKGTIRDVQWVNPNVYLLVEAQSAGQTVMYQVRGANPNALNQQGVKPGMFKAGDEIEVFGYRAFSSPTTIGIALVTLPNGTELFLGRSLLP